MGRCIGTRYGKHCREANTAQKRRPGRKEIEEGDAAKTKLADDAPQLQRHRVDAETTQSEKHSPTNIAAPWLIGTVCDANAANIFRKFQS